MTSLCERGGSDHPSVIPFLVQWAPYLCSRYFRLGGIACCFFYGCIPAHFIEFGVPCLDVENGENGESEACQVNLMGNIKKERTERLSLSQPP